MPCSPYLSETVSLEELHRWLVGNERSFRAYLKACRSDASDLVAAIRDLPCVRVCQASWQNDRPFPSDPQLLLLAFLLSPGQCPTRLDEETLGTLEAALCMMALPDPVPAFVEIDIHARRFRWDRAAACAL